MTAPANTQIMDIVGSRLGNISKTNGYFADVKKIERGRMTPWTDYDLPAVNYWPASMENADQNHRTDIRNLMLYVEIHASTRDRPFSDVADELAADIITALNRDTAKPLVSDAVSHDLAGAVNRLRLLGYDYEIGTGQAPWCGAMVRFEIRYRSDRNEMFSFDA